MTPGDKAPGAKTPAPPPSVGGLLRQRRQMRGQSLEAVHQSTRVPRSLLQALEEDRFQDFPAPVYLRGFLKTYCEHLDLEFEPLWQRAIPAPSVEEDAPKSPRAGVSSRTLPSLAPFLVVGGLFMAGVMSWGVLRLQRRPHPKPTTPEPAFALIPSTPAVASVELSSPVADRALSRGSAASDSLGAAAAGEIQGPPRPERTGPQRLLVTATAGGFVRLLRDGKLVFEGRLPAGKYLDWRGTAFELRASNPRGLRVELGDALLDLAVMKAEPDGSYRLGRR